MMAAAALWSAAAAPAAAQIAAHGGVEATTDERRRGLSWSEGRAAVSAWARADLPAGFDLGARVTTTRGDARHGGAEAAIEPTLGYARDLGGVRLDGFVTGHVFTGGVGALGYVEGGAGASYTLGPAELGAEARYAPLQDAIGGDNLYLGVRARVGVPATPWTVVASAGRSSGAVRDAARAARLRPAGRYADWSLGVQRISGPLTLGLTYSGTDIGDDGPDASPFAVRRHAGDRIAARVAIGF